jgi:hypothetical protein
MACSGDCFTCIGTEIGEDAKCSGRYEPEKKECLPVHYSGDEVSYRVLSRNTRKKKLAQQ